MSDNLNFLALDLGAESGRGIIGSLGGGKLGLEVVHRFPTGATRVGSSLYLDALRLFDEMKRCLKTAAKTEGGLAGVGIDTWGVDYALLGRGDVLLGNPHLYRDPRTDGIMEEAFKRAPAEEIYRHTGAQLMQINTLYQLFSMVVTQSPILEAAETILLLPNLFSFWLSGIKVAEFTHASTSQCYSPSTRDWAWEVLKKLDIPTKIFPEIVQPGTMLGPLLPEVAEETGAQNVPVILAASHDTASAIVAVPTTTENYMFISSGTWSVTGMETSEPVVVDSARAGNFANEGCFGGHLRLVKNIMGLWLVQESRRTWAGEGEELSYDEITRLAAGAQPFKCLIDPDDASFLPPGDMPGRVREFCRKTGQPIPETKGEVIRTILESLALRYRWTADRLEQLTGRSIDVIHIVGGGGQNKLLCQFTADASRRPVIAGPVEATAAGNVLVQAIAVGKIGSLAEARQIVRDSFDLDRFEPGDAAKWEDAYDRFRKVTEAGQWVG